MFKMPVTHKKYTLKKKILMWQQTTSKNAYCGACIQYKRKETFKNCQILKIIKNLENHFKKLEILSRKSSTISKILKISRFQKIRFSKKIFYFWILKKNIYIYIENKIDFEYFLKCFRFWIFFNFEKKCFDFEKKNIYIYIGHFSI